MSHTSIKRVMALFLAGLLLSTAAIANEKNPNSAEGDIQKARSVQSANACDFQSKTLGAISGSQFETNLNCGSPAAMPQLNTARASINFTVNGKAFVAAVKNQAPKSQYAKIPAKPVQTKANVFKANVSHSGSNSAAGIR